MRILFFLGAGASYGSEEDITCRPKLAADLFQTLCDQFPLTWGKLYSKYRQSFLKDNDFEKGMNSVIKEQPEKVLELQRNMAQYFFNFNPSADSLYFRLIEKLGIENLSFASLNYDRLIEEAIIRSGFLPKNNLEMKKEKEVYLCLPHGCSNYFLEGIEIPPGLFETTCVENAIDSSDMKMIRHLEEFQLQISSNALPPVMSCFNSRKDSLVGRMFLDSQEIMFAKMVLSAELIVIVGVNVREHDKHIWSPLSKTKAKIVYCSGEDGAKGFNSWVKECRKEKKHRIFDGYFLEHFDDICNEVKSFNNEDS